MRPNRRKELIDWFYSHDEEWQNDYLLEAEYPLDDDRFWDEIERVYGDLI